MSYRIRMVAEVRLAGSRYAEAIRRSRTRYERDQGGTG